MDRRTIENILPQERYHLVPEKSLQCLPCATQTTRGDRAVYMHRAGPGAMGHRRYLKAYDHGPNGIVRNKEEWSGAPKRFPWYRPTWPTSPPRPIALSHRITHVPCIAAVAPWLLRHPRCPKRALHFSLKKLNLAFHPLANSYSRVTVLSVFCAQNIFFSGPSVWGPVNIIRCLVWKGKIPTRENFGETLYLTCAHFTRKLFSISSIATNNITVL